VNYKGGFIIKHNEVPADTIVLIDSLCLRRNT